MPSIDQWQAAWQGLGVTCTPALRHAFDDMVARYSEPHRKYHTLHHLDECFARLEEIRREADHPAEVKMALWFHDAIYDTRSNRNEARSAELAKAAVLDEGGSLECARRIESLVMATGHAATPTGPDAEVMVDVDLWILGAPADRFDQYEGQVRQEYGWVPEIMYRRQRSRILARLLTRASIFSTPQFRARYEARARANIARSLDALAP